MFDTQKFNFNLQYRFIAWCSAMCNNSKVATFIHDYNSFNGLIYSFTNQIRRTCPKVSNNNINI